MTAETIGTGRRGAAFAIDFLIISVCLWGLARAFGLQDMDWLMMTEEGFTRLLVCMIIGHIGAIAYYIGFITSPWQATPGKRLMGYYVAQADNSHPPAFRPLVASLVSTSMVGIMLFCALIFNSAFLSRSMTAQELKHCLAGHYEVAPEELTAAQMKDSLSNEPWFHCQLNNDQTKFSTLIAKQQEHEVLTREDTRFAVYVVRTLLDIHARNSGLFKIYFLLWAALMAATLALPLLKNHRAAWKQVKLRPLPGHRP
jgi:uncharacterized RDD family membrane protein YckC